MHLHNMHQPRVPCGGGGGSSPAGLGRLHCGGGGSAKGGGVNVEHGGQPRRVVAPAPPAIAVRSGTGSGPAEQGQ